MMNVEEAITREASSDKTVARRLYDGMPRIDNNDKKIAFFEFWPSALVYAPVVFQWLWLAGKYQSLSLPLLANPSIPLSGMVGESKADIFALASGKAKESIAPWMTIDVKADVQQSLVQACTDMENMSLVFPVVAKPDVGCRGAGVRIIRDCKALKAYIEHYPVGSRILLQKLVQYEPEAGIFYVREPGQKKGHIISMTLKYAPYVIGNGVDTLKQLILNDTRAGRLSHLYFPRHKAQLNKVLSKDELFRLAFSGSHCRGSIFKDGRAFITRQLVQVIDEIADGLSEYNYGRIDVRFRDINALMAGKHFTVLEFNGASSEAAHIWDSGSSLKELYRVLFYQYRTLFRLGDMNRKRGYTPPGLLALFKAWRREKALVQHYPDTE